MDVDKELGGGGVRVGEGQDGCERRTEVMVTVQQKIGGGGQGGCGQRIGGGGEGLGWGESGWM